MPGITVVVDPPAVDILDNALESACFLDIYTRHIVYDGGRSTVAHSGYDRYPVDVFDIDNCTIVLEGYLYDTVDLEKSLTDVVRLLIDGNTDPLTEWIATRDGDFLLVVVDRTDGTTWVLNDAFGRLPTYYTTIEGSAILSRELGVVRSMARNLSSDLEPDHLGLGQMLLFGYPLGTRTLFTGVSQLSPGSLLEVGSGAVSSLYDFRVDGHANATRDIDTNSRILRDRFVQACANRAAPVDETVVSLSGGLDSRAVIAGLSRVNCQLSAATSLRKDRANATEVEVAKRVAEAFNVTWKSYTAERTDRHESLLLEMAQGMNSLEMSLGLNFAEQVAASHGDVMFLTGDGGDKALPDLTPTKTLESTADLVDYIIKSKKVIPIDEVTSLVDITTSELVQSVEERVARYPEADIDSKYVHFFVRERGINWLNHGEDRTRYFVWASTPFYALPFFQAAMACPPEQKRRTRLYSKFLELLSPVTVEIDYVDFGASIDSFEYQLKRYAYDWLSEHPDINARVSKMLGTKCDRSSDRPVRKLEAEIRRSSSVNIPFSEPAIQHIVQNHETYSRKQLYVLLTLVSAIAYDDKATKRSISQ